MIKSKGMSCLELLSPAKDLASGKLAVLSGADAVYIGGPDFSARYMAGNSWEDIEKLCTFAHIYYAKVFVTVNTIFFNGEEQRLQETLYRAYQAGADALIIQDMGVLNLDVPPIPLIASTQCHNYDPKHIRFLRDSGFSRVILARELSIEQIVNIHKEVPDIELEAFVHGALCVSYSGRCSMSQFLSGRSANRGKCMQACRLPFDLIDSNDKLIQKNKYLLSTKDLKMSGHLNDLIEAGVTSFKIEGRLKDSAYAGNVTSAYSKELNSIISKDQTLYRRSSSGRSNPGFDPDLSKSFNRGFTEYFYFGRQESVISENGQRSPGEFIGTVKEINKSYFKLNEPHDLKNGDGICWTGTDGELEGVNINSVDGDKIYPFRKFPVAEGTAIYRNENPSFERSVLKGAQRRISIKIEVVRTNEDFIIKALDEDGNTVKKVYSYKAEIAENRSVAKDNWRKQFSKTGESVFYPESINVDSVSKYFVPVSTLNSWRREILNLLEHERANNYQRISDNHARKKSEYYMKKIDSSYNVSNYLAVQFYNESGSEVIKKAYEISDKDDIEVLMTTKHCLKYHLGGCARFGGSDKYNEPLFLVLNGKKFRLDFDCLKCEMKIIK